MTGSDLPGNLQ